MTDSRGNSNATEALLTIQSVDEHREEEREHEKGPSHPKQEKKKPSASKDKQKQKEKEKQKEKQKRTTIATLTATYEYTEESDRETTTAGVTVTTSNRGGANMKLEVAGGEAEESTSTILPAGTRLLLNAYEYFYYKLPINCLYSVQFLLLLIFENTICSESLMFRYTG